MTSCQNTISTAPLRLCTFALNNIRAVAPVTVLLAAALFAVGCGKKQEAAAATNAAPKVAVAVKTISSQPRPVTEMVVANVRAKVHATLSAKLSGRIEVMPVTLGQKISTGQLIARLDAGEVKARMDQAQAALQQAQREWDRVSALFQQQTASKSEADAAEARLRSAQAAVAEAKAMLSYAEITAPFDAVVTKRWAEVGDLASPGKPVVDIEDFSAFQIEAEVPEAIAPGIKLGDTLQVRVDNRAAELGATVCEISPAADTVSHTFRVKLDLPQASGLMSGQFARLLVPVGSKDSLFVPAAAVVRRGQLEIIFVVANGKAQLRLVKTGGSDGGEIEILSGLSSGETVAVSGAAQLTDGQPVEAK